MSYRDRIKALVRVAPSQLEPHPKNWRTHPPEQRQAIEGILGEIGYAGALICRPAPGDNGDGDRYQIIDGHLRQDVTLDGTVPILVLDLDDAETDKLLATFDPIGDMATVDHDRLRELLTTVDFGEELLAVNKHLQDLIPLVEQPVMEDGIPLPPDEAITQPGDLWVLGEHRLLCGDSGSTEDVDRLLDGQPIHLVNTDPPYNVKVEPRSNNAIAAGLSSFTAPDARHDGKLMPHQSFDAAHQGPKKATHRKLRPKDRPLEGDFLSDEQFAQLLRAWFGQIVRVLLPGRAAYIWGGYTNCANYPAALKEAGLYLSQVIVWDKEHPVLTRKDFMGAHESCFYTWREGAAHVYLGPNNATDLWHVKKVNPQGMIHLTEKPVELAVRALQYSSRVGENVLDLFGGSGSTLIAAEQLGRHAHLMEFDAPYCDVICKRWANLTGKSPIRESDGTLFSELENNVGAKRLCTT